MTPQQALADLNRLGTAQNRKVYARHGVGENMFGVSYANQNALAKKIKTDNELALKLWESENHDARILATMIADPDDATAGQINEWAKALDNYVLTDALTSFVAKTRFAQAKADQWAKDRKEFKSAAGWSLVTYLAQSDGNELPDDYFESRLKEIEKQIHGRPNRTRYAMNLALIGIGIRNAKLRKMAEAAAERIGPVEVDHGETGCKTPDAVPYIANAWKRKDGKKQKASTPAKKPAKRPKSRAK